MIRLARHATFSLTLCLVAAGAQGQGLADPTRPPAFTGGMPGEAPVAGKQLQSVLLSKGRKLAIIDGTTVPLGGMLGEARVVRISETEVVLKMGEETETLKLYPGVDKQPVKRAATRARTAASAQESSSRGGSK